MKTNYFLLFFVFFLFGKNSEAQITAPFTETFDSTTFSSNWIQSATTGGPWVLTGSMGYGGSAITDHTGAIGSTRAWIDFSGTDVGVVLQLDTVDVSALTTPEFSFWFNCNIGTYTLSPLNLLFVEVNNGTSWVVIDSLQQDNQGVWSEHFYDVTSHVFGVSKLLIRFRAESGGSTADFYQDLAIDDISVKEAPTCRGVKSLSAYNITTNSAISNWVGDTLNDSTYRVEWGILGFSIGSGTVVTSLADTLAISSLSPNTDYSFYVKTICKNGDSSAYVGPFSFKTLCATDTINHLRDFSVWPPACWDLT